MVKGIGGIPKIATPEGEIKVRGGGQGGINFRTKMSERKY